ncbi:hypothetical protein ABWH88_04135 [Marinobacter adhaerens]|uniref:Uncharacterized protein n=1 Tax=Marinobacter adhaerens TaxID=1033846 RepID=A0ABX8IT06_9GAMM|nr:hypothetical protein [Marinobacter adhaerens]MBW4980462.1 hypothetical protein [Marinobacter adhaerens]QWV14912.1 hypothetical protein KQ249_10130 [Marinobacter adhaerens]
MTIRSPHRDALRILFVLRAGGSSIEPPTAEHALIFKGEARLQAFDFWMRNPDYLAAELLDLFIETKDKSYYEAAQAIIDDEEPDLRRVPMTRYFFGAYERLDDALSLLRSRDLVRISGIKGANNKVLETDFVLTKAGYDICSAAVSQEPILSWYAKRSKLVAKVAGSMGGTALKQKQYQRASYAETKLGGIIPPITEEVRLRLTQLQSD